MVKFDAPEDLSGGSTWLEHDKKNEGKHVVMMNNGLESERPGKKDEANEAIEGFHVETEIKCGSEESKKFGFTMYDGKPGHSDGGEFARKKQAGFAIATDLIKPSDLGKPVSFELKDGIGSIFVIDIRLGKPKDANDPKSPRYLEVMACYHIDDPRVKDFLAGKDIAADVKTILEGIPKENRHNAEYFAPLLAKKDSAPKKPPITDESFGEL